MRGVRSAFVLPSGVLAPAVLASGVLGSVVLASALAACAGRAEPTPTPRPVASAGPVASVSGAVDLTRGEVARALGEVGLQLEDARVPFRAPEPVSFETVPRAVVHALVPEDPTRGFITIYEFTTAGAAADGGRSLAGYLRSGFGRAQFTPDTRHTVRQLGTTLVYFFWSPASVLDPRTGDVEKALLLVGQEVELPG